MNSSPPLKTDPLADLSRGHKTWDRGRQGRSISHFVILTACPKKKKNICTPFNSLVGFLHPLEEHAGLCIRTISDATV